MTTPVLGLPEVTDGQASQAAIHNEALRELMAKTVRVLSRTTTAEPGSPADGDAYILPSGFSGASWGGSAVNRIAHYIGGIWQFYAPAEGWRVWVNNENITVAYDGSAWLTTTALPSWPCVAVSTTPFSVTALHRGTVLICDTTSGSITLNLVAVATAGNGFVFAVKKKVAGNSLIIDPSGAELIDDATTMTLTDDEDSRIIVTDGSEWHAIGGGGSGGGGSTQPFSDATAMFKNDADATKTIKVDLSGLSTATERTVAYPNKSGTHAFLDDVAPGGNGDDQFAEDSANHNGLLYAYKAGAIRTDNVVVLVPAGTVLLTEGMTNYVQVNSAGTVSANTTGFTVAHFPMAIVTTIAGSPSGIDVVNDKRAWATTKSSGAFAYTQDATAKSSGASTNFPFDGTIPQNTEGVAYTELDTTITPKNASSTLVIDVELSVCGSASTTATFGLFVDSVADAIKAWPTQLGGADHAFSVRLRYLVAAGSTNARTYKVRWGGAFTVLLNRANSQADLYSTAALSSMMITEILP